MERLEHLEFKFAPEGMNAKTGEFAGYGAIFGNRDSHGDVIERGAFRDSLRQWEAKGALPAMKLMHGSVANPFTGSDLPVGKWKVMREDERGLHVEGKLSGMDTDRGRFHYSLMEDGALSGLSIGYKAVRHSPGTGEIKRRLHALHLSEVSLVPEGSNEQAIISELKSWSDGEEPTPRQFENFLRDVGGFSKSLSVAIASKATPLLNRGEPDSADELAEFLRGLTA